MNILDVKLKTGEEFLCDVLENNDDEIVVQYAVVISRDPIDPNSVNLAPIMNYGDVAQILTFKHTDIMVLGTPIDGLIKTMEDKFGNYGGVIVTPQQQDIQTESSILLG